MIVSFQVNLASERGRNTFLGDARMTVETWLWIGTIGMLLGTVPLYFALVSNKSEYDEGDYMAHFYVPLIAFTLYLLMALGAGAMHTSIGRVYYFGRYVDWTFTTPLLLYSLVVSGLKGTGVKRNGLLIGLLGADVYMIATGFIAGLTDNPTVKWSFYICSCVSFLAIYALLFGPYKKLTAAGQHGSTYVKKAGFLSIVWFAYPVVFLFGQEGLRYWSATWDATFFTILDLTAKVAYGLWAVSLAKQSAAASGDFDRTVAATAVR